MAKTTSLVTDGLQGTIGGITFVKSKRYGKYARSKRGSIKPAVLNKKMKASSSRMLKANPIAKLFFDAIKDDHKDGTLWSRLLSIYRKQVKGGWDPSVQCLQGLECNIEFRLDAILGSYKLKTHVSNNVLEIDLILDRVPIWEKAKYLDGYQISVICVFVNMAQRRTKKIVKAGRLESMHSELESRHFDIRIPSLAKEYVLLLKIEGAEKGKLIGTDNVKGMAVVEVGII